MYPGIFAGVWPCGIVTIIGELYGSESLTQVYGFLHSYMHDNADKLSDLSKSAIRSNCVR